jgi:hypothetical protein
MNRFIKHIILESKEDNSKILLKKLDELGLKGDARTEKEEKIFQFVKAELKEMGYDVNEYDGRISHEKINDGYIKIEYGIAKLKNNLLKGVYDNNASYKFIVNVLVSSKIRPEEGEYGVLLFYNKVIDNNYPFFLITDFRKKQPIISYDYHFKLMYEKDMNDEEEFTDVLRKLFKENFGIENFILHQYL